MMAKMFYTLEETKGTLGKSEDEIKQYAREGRLREFRDGPRLMFKADQVDQLKSEMGGGDLGAGSGLGNLGPSDSGAGIGLVGDIGASGSGTISLADTDFGKSPGAGMVKDDTALATDLGLSGSMGGVPSPTRGVGSGTGLSGTASGRGGITVFDVDDGGHVDPSAQTAIGSGIHDQVNLEGVGSGSGLLDLTRESDDTSLGAELLDEISPTPSAGRGGRPPSLVGDSGMDMEPISSAPPPLRGGGRSPVGGGTVYVEAHDALAPAFGAMALFGAILLIAAGFVVANAILGVRPELVSKLSGQFSEGRGFLYLAGAGLGAVVFFIVGWIIGKAGAPSRR